MFSYRYDKKIIIPNCMLCRWAHAKYFCGAQGNSAQSECYNTKACRELYQRGWPLPPEDTAPPEIL